MSASKAILPLPEKGFNKTRRASCAGIPKKLNMGDNKFVKISVNPLACISSLIISIVAIYGKIDVNNGITVFMPAVKA